MLNVISYGNFNYVGKNPNKKQIILTHTSRDIENYLMSLKCRYDGKYNKIPNYVIDRGGNILKLLDDNEFGNIFNDMKINYNFYQLIHWH